MTKEIKQIKKGALRRRLAIGTAGARSGIGLLQSRASGLLLPKAEREQHNLEALEREAMRFVAHLGELKGAYVKIGQMLALYGEHLLPEPITKALHTLEHQTSSLAWTAIKPHIENLLAEKTAQIEIEESAFAAASLAQVHRAKVMGADGQQCIKIQYPGISDAIDSDFDSVVQMLKLAKWLKAGRDAEQFTSQLKTYLLQEADYRHELACLEEISEYLRPDSRYIVPKTYHEFCNDKCLVMDYVDGYAVTDARVQNLSQERRNNLAEAMLALFFKEIFVWNKMQTDPNFGNYRIQIGETKDQLVLLDFGAVHVLPETRRAPLLHVVLGRQRPKPGRQSHL
ncbi:MAG: AarF/ABC1/UbiB kinase family protein, partial [Pseudomonadota bacterium]